MEGGREGGWLGGKEGEREGGRRNGGNRETSKIVYSISCAEVRRNYLQTSVIFCTSY